LEEAVVRLQREFQWTAPAHAAATEARLTTLLVCAVRATHPLHGALRGTRGPRATLVARFRQAVEANLRAGWELRRYAKSLGVTPTRLRDACLEVTGRPPTHIVHERLILEAKRSLKYTNMTIAETAYDLGFSDPAYFSRFFSERVGVSPAEFRRRADSG